MKTKNKTTRILSYFIFNAIVLLVIYLGVFTHFKDTGVLILGKAMLWFMSITAGCAAIAYVISDWAIKPGYDPKMAKIFTKEPYCVPYWFDALLDFVIVFIVAYAGWTVTACVYLLQIGFISMIRTSHESIAEKVNEQSY